MLNLILLVSDFHLYADRFGISLKCDTSVKLVRLILRPEIKVLKVSFSKFSVSRSRDTLGTAIKRAGPCVT